jgi:hypothetical protein
MLSNTSNIFVDDQNTAVGAAKRKEDDIAAQVTTFTVQQEQHALVVTVAVARNTLDEA